MEGFYFTPLKIRYVHVTIFHAYLQASSNLKTDTEFFFEVPTIASKIDVTPQRCQIGRKTAVNCSIMQWNLTAVTNLAFVIMGK